MGMEWDSGHLDWICLISRCWIRGSGSAYFLIRRLNKSINSNIKVFTTTFRYMLRMYYICISIHTYGLVKYNTSNENYYICNKIYTYCNKDIDKTVI